MKLTDKIYKEIIDNEAYEYITCAIDDSGLDAKTVEGPELRAYHSAAVESLGWADDDILTDLFDDFDKCPCPSDIRDGIESSIYATYRINR